MTSLNANSALRLASFDGGGLRSFSQLKMMEVFMHQLQSLGRPEERQKDILPYQYFDMMGGSDAGGLIVIMLARLRLSVKEAIAEFAGIVQNVYPEGLKPEERTSRLRGCMQSLLAKRGFPQDLKMEDEVQDGHCVGFVVTALRLNVRTKVCLRTYPVKSDLPSDITVIDAALATCASQPEFLPISYGAWYERQEYVGAGLGANNPVRQVITEARSYFTGEPSVSVLLSLGSGHPGILALGTDDKGAGLYRVMHEMMRDSEKEAQDIQQQMAQVTSYFRFSVEQGMQRIDDRAKALDWITIQTKSYLELPKLATKIAEFIGNLSLGIGVISLTQLEVRITGMSGRFDPVEVPVQGQEEIRSHAFDWQRETSSMTVCKQEHNPKAEPRQIEAKQETPVHQVQALQSESVDLPTKFRRAKLVDGHSKSHIVQSFVMNYLGIPRWSVHAS